MIKVLNLSIVPLQKIEALQERLEEIIPEDVQSNLPAIEVWNHPNDVHTPEEIEKFKADNPEFNPDNSFGEEYEGRILVYQKAFQYSVYQTVMVVIHEIGHLMIDGGSEEGADKWAWENILISQKKGKV
ncbi:MAG: hypothetical protein ABIA08_00220 [bacterium]